VDLDKFSKIVQNSISYDFDLSIVVAIDSDILLIYRRTMIFLLIFSEELLFLSRLFLEVGFLVINERF